jgi:hypothetical protein
VDAKTQLTATFMESLPKHEYRKAIGFPEVPLTS